jgi:hypothetical protein
VTAPEPTQPLTDAERTIVAVLSGESECTWHVGCDAEECYGPRARAIMAALVEQGPADLDEEFDAVREAALKWVGGKEVKDLLDAFDWLRSEMTYALRLLDYKRKQHTDLEGAFDLVIKQCGKLRAERDGVAGLLDKVMELHPASFCESCNVEGPCPTRRAALDQSGEGQANATE